MAISAINTTTQTTLTAPTILYSINAQTGTTYTAVATDAAAFVTMNNASANNFYIPTNASVAFAIGTTLNVVSIGDGICTIQATTPGTTTVNAIGGANNAVANPQLRGKYSAATCLKIDTDRWIVMGDVY